MTSGMTIWGPVPEAGERLVYTTDTALGANTDFDTPIGGSSADWRVRGLDTEVLVSAETDQASDSGGVVVEESEDGSSVHKTTFLDGDDGGGGSGAAIAANEGVGQIIGLTRPFWRFRWQNAGTPQGAFSARVSAR